MKTLSVNMTAEEIIKHWQDTFRILKDWDIKFNPKSKYTCQCVPNPITRTAIIYRCCTFGNKDVNQHEYFFHEIQHICFSEILRKESRGWRKQAKISHEKEEIYIQDLQNVLFHPNITIKTFREEGLYRK